MSVESAILSLTLVLRRGLLQPPKIFLEQRFVPNKLRQRVLFNCLYTFYTSFDVSEVKYGGVVWAWGSSKIMVGGGLVKSHDVFILSIS